MVLQQECTIFFILFFFFLNQSFIACDLYFLRKKRPLQNQKNILVFILTIRVKW
jgi:hypothetical protein